MTTETTLPVQAPEPPQPSAEQRERRERRKRFYRLRVILPMVLVALLWLVVTLLLLWLTVAGEWFAIDTDQAYYRTLVSGISDFLLILAILPLLLLCALPSALTVGLVVYRRKQKQARPPEPEKLPLLWRVENGIKQVEQRLAQDILPKVAQPVISAHALVAFVKAFVRELREIITREINRYVRR